MHGCSIFICTHGIVRPCLLHFHSLTHLICHSVFFVFFVLEKKEEKKKFCSVLFSWCAGSALLLFPVKFTLSHLHLYYSHFSTATFLYDMR